MAQKSTIEWTDATWNPVRGCTKISAGCKHCYAEVFAERWRGIPGHPYEQGFDLRLVPERLADPIGWSQPRMIFVNSMSDLFQEDVPVEYIRLVFEVMSRANWHIYQVLTKRGARMREVLRSFPRRLVVKPHIWLGVSVENRKHGLPRLAELAATPARIRFLSVEPLLEDLGTFSLKGVHWVIVGGESGPGARPMSPAWVRSIREQCTASSTPFFFKQWGGTRKKKAGRVLDGTTYDELPQVPRPLPPERNERVELRREIDQLIAESSFSGTATEQIRTLAQRRPTNR